MGIEFDNARDAALSGFFSCGSETRISGSRETDLVSLGFGWEEQVFHLCFPSSGAKFLFYCLLLNLDTIGCLS